MDIYQILKTHNRPWTNHEIACFLVLMMILIGCLLYAYKQKKITFSQIISIVALVWYLAIVFASTVFTRMPTGEYRCQLQVFCSWGKVAAGSSEMLKENLLNCLLLLPLGMLLPFSCEKEYLHFGR